MGAKTIVLTGRHLLYSSCHVDPQRFNWNIAQVKTHRYNDITIVGRIVYERSQVYAFFPGGHHGRLEDKEECSINRILDHARSIGTGLWLGEAGMLFRRHGLKRKQTEGRIPIC